MPSLHYAGCMRLTALLLYWAREGLVNGDAPFWSAQFGQQAYTTQSLYLDVAHLPGSGVTEDVGRAAVLLGVGVKKDRCITMRPPKKHPGFSVNTVVTRVVCADLMNCSFNLMCGPSSYWTATPFLPKHFGLNDFYRAAYGATPDVQAYLREWLSILVKDWRPYYEAQGWIEL